MGHLIASTMSGNSSALTSTATPANVRTWSPGRGPFAHIVRTWFSSLPRTHRQGSLTQSESRCTLPMSSDVSTLAPCSTRLAEPGMRTAPSHHHPLRTCLPIGLRCACVVISYRHYHDGAQALRDLAFPKAVQTKVNQSAISLHRACVVTSCWHCHDGTQALRYLAMPLIVVAEAHKSAIGLHCAS